MADASQQTGNIEQPEQADNNRCNCCVCCDDSKTAAPETTAHADVRAENLAKLDANLVAKERAFQADDFITLKKLKTERQCIELRLQALDSLPDMQVELDELKALEKWDACLSLQTDMDGIRGGHLGSFVNACGTNNSLTCAHGKRTIQVRHWSCCGLTKTKSQCFQMDDNHDKPAVEEPPEMPPHVFLIQNVLPAVVTFLAMLK
jgi:hypothetical protein